MKKKKIVILAAVYLLTAGIIGTLAVQHRKYEKNHVFVEDQVYDAHAQQLDLRGTGISQQHYEELSGKLPECRILWDVPFQGKTVPSDTETLTITELTEQDIAVLRYFPDLREIDGTQCRDYEMLMLLREKRPNCDLKYQVEIGNQVLDKNTQSVRLKSGESSGEELLERLAYLPDLRKVSLTEPTIPSQQLDQLLETYDKVEFSWTKTAFGRQLDTGIEELDVSGMHFESLEEVRQQADYFPNLKTLVMCNCGFQNEEMKEFRDQVRDRYKVVWNVQVGTMDLRTDIKDFFPDRDHGKVYNKDLYNLRYCEDLICVDVGHLGHSDVDWVVGTPHLKYLIMSDGGAQDITPLGQLQELEFLELFMTGVRDTSPLLNCKALRDLNLCRAPLEDITPLTQMTWLEKLWVSHCPISREERQLLKDSLPNTYIEFDEFFSTWGGWRDMPRYFDMRDVLHMPYMR